MAQDYSVVATFATAAAAKKEAAALVTLFRDHAKQYDAQAPTPAMALYAKRVGKTWRGPLAWGDEGLEGDLPLVGTHGPSVLVFHDYWHRTDELAEMLEAAGAEVTTASGPPLLEFQLTFAPGAAGTKLRRSLDALFAQREEPHLCDWKQPSWAKGNQFLGESEDIWVVHGPPGKGAGTVTFTFPVSPADLPRFEKLLAAGASRLAIRPATARRVGELKRQELAAMKVDVPATTAEPRASASGPIPKAAPKVTTVAKGSDAFLPKELATDGTRVVAVGFSKLYTTVDPTKGPAAGIALEGKVSEGLCAHGGVLWLAGYGGVLRTTDGGKTFTASSVPDHREGAPMLYAIARAPDGVLWVGGYGGRILSSKDGDTFKPTKGVSKSTVQRFRPTSLGVFVLTYDGELGLIHGGKVTKLAVREPLGLSDLCVTPAGTLVAVGGRHGTGAVQRSTDGGKTFTAGKAPTSLYTVAALPDGRLVAGGDAALAVSYDDGKTFQPLPYKATKGRNFTVALAIGDSVLLGGPWQDLVRVDP